MILRDEDNKVNIIVVNWNGERFLKDCLGALSGQTYANYEIILVDNGSSDNSVCFTRKNFPEVKIVALSGGSSISTPHCNEWLISAPVFLP